MHALDEYGPTGQMETGPRRSSRVIWWVLGSGAVAIFLCCGGAIAFLGYLGVNSPDTSVYPGNRVPARFVRTVESTGALDEGEKILYFYSDAMTDIRDGFYFVSDRKVVVYIENERGSPLTVVPFEIIVQIDFFSQYVVS